MTWTCMFHVQRNAAEFSIMMLHDVKLLKRPKQLTTAQALQISSAQWMSFLHHPQQVFHTWTYDREVCCSPHYQISQLQCYVRIRRWKRFWENSGQQETSVSLKDFKGYYASWCIMCHDLSCKGDDAACCHVACFKCALEVPVSKCFETSSSGRCRLHWCSWLGTASNLKQNKICKVDKDDKDDKVHNKEEHLEVSWHPATSSGLTLVIWGRFWQLGEIWTMELRTDSDVQNEKVWRKCEESVCSRRPVKTLICLPLPNCSSGIVSASCRDQNWHLSTSSDYAGETQCCI